ncbi:hypothetical protein JCM16303_003349 [Sporobolomyces ruberrimus]
MVRPPPGLVTSAKEVATRAISSTTKGGASKLIRPALKFQRPIRPQARNASSTASAAPPEPSFFRLLYEGVFTSVRSAAIPRAGPYSGQRLAARPPPSPFRQTQSAGFSSSARPRPQSSRFGPTPRPSFYPTQTSQLGLGAARKFSSSGYAVFENVVHNAPLALRALADQGKDGLDERKWRAIRREIRKNEKTDVKGKGAIEGQRMKENVKAEFANYFSVPVAAAEPLSLFLVLDPEVSFASTTPSSSSHAVASTSEFDASYRLLSPSVLSVFEHFTQSYTSHAHRLRSLINGLSAAGLLDDASLLKTDMFLDPNTNKRIWKVEFLDGFLTRARLESILRGYSEENRLMDWKSKVTNWNGTRMRLGKGENEWWWLEGGRSTTTTNVSSLDLDALSDTTPSTYLQSPVESTFFSPSSPSVLTPDQSFMLPDPSSLEFSPPLSPSLEPTTWNAFDVSSSSSVGFAFEGPEMQDFDAIESWSTTFEDESDVGEGDWSSAGSVAGVGSEVEVDGVQQFLDEIEKEQERLSTSWR